MQLLAVQYIPLRLDKFILRITHYFGKYRRRRRSSRMYVRVMQTTKVVLAGRHVSSLSLKKQYINVEFSIWRKVSPIFLKLSVTSYVTNVPNDAPIQSSK